jgi:hypothetical protein
MRYSLVLATLAASAIATPYINVEVSEPGDLLEEASRQGNNHRGLKHHNRDDERRHRRNRNWFSSLWSSDDDVEEERNRREREDRRRNRRQHDRNHRNGRGRRERDNEDDGRYNDDENMSIEVCCSFDLSYRCFVKLIILLQTYSAGNLIDDLFGTDFECVIQAESEHQERRGARECCRQVGGELYDEPGRCIFRDVFENPREEWRDCALENKGANFADCYYREQREVDDSLSSRRRNQRDSRRGNKDEERDSRDSRDRRSRSRSRSRSRNGRNDRQHVLEIEEDNERNGRNGGIQCQVEVDDQERERQIVRECCNNNQVQGRLNHNDERVSKSRCPIVKRRP